MSDERCYIEPAFGNRVFSLSQGKGYPGGVLRYLEQVHQIPLGTGQLRLGFDFQLTHLHEEVEGLLLLFLFGNPFEVRHLNVDIALSPFHTIIIETV